ncbi:MAG: YebC/PmpR family DNA-binding transcriptional regulator, partial [Gemmatimonadales bacterium]
STSPAEFHAVQDALRASGFELESAELEMVPKNEVKLDGAELETLLRLIETLEELDDVAKVFSNFDADESRMAEAEASH